MKRTTTTSHKVTLTRGNLIDLIRDAFDIPKDADINFNLAAFDAFAVASWSGEEPNTVHLGGCAASEQSFLDSLRTTQKVLRPLTVEDTI